MTDLFGNQPAVFAASIITLAYLAPWDRRRFFLEWLCAHDRRLACKKDDMPGVMNSALKKWFTSLPEWDALQEYERVVSEIGWWRDLQEETLAQMLEE